MARRAASRKSKTRAELRANRSTNLHPRAHRDDVLVYENASAIN
jgi:hypothetical protein